MNLHEWEILSDDDGLLDYKDDEKKIVSAKRNSSASDAKILFDMNYFLCPSMDSKDISSQPTRDSSRLPKQPMIPVHLLQVKIPDDSLALKEIGEVPLVIGGKEDQKGGVLEADQDTVTQVFFKKMKENEFVDMKIDSPRSSNKGTKAQIDVGHYQFDDGGEAIMENITTNSPRMNLMSQNSNKESSDKDDTNWDGSIGGLNILKGIGAICSFGVAAATVCILFYGGNQQKLRIQIYTDDKVRNSKLLCNITRQ